MNTPATGALPAELTQRFDWLRRLGGGSSGTVHAALDRQLHRVVALKLVPLAEGSPLLRERFDAEAQAARRLAHPDIVTTLDSGIAARHGWLAMELVAGVPLSRYTAPARLLPEPLVLQAGARLAAALAHAHTQGVLHRDLKPANVMVHWPSGVLKLGDFGLARLVASQATRSGVLLGSPAYMAPELLAGAPPAAASDLYALGATLFELFTGRPPFVPAGGSMGELLRQVASQPAPPLCSIRPELPPTLDALLAQLLAKRAAHRPASARDVASQLHALRPALAGV
jgi:serine/threonine-protein kinase